MLLNNQELYVVNIKGEVFDTIESDDSYIKVSSGDKVIKKGVIDFLNNTITLKYRFVKMNPLVYVNIAKKYSILTSLVAHVNYTDGILVYENGKTIRLKDLSKICHVSQSTVKRQIKGLCEEDIVHKVKVKGKPTYLVFNPYIAYIGKKINVSLYDEFKDSKWSSEIDKYGKEEMDE